MGMRPFTTGNETDQTLGAQQQDSQCNDTVDPKGGADILKGGFTYPPFLQR